MGSLTVVAERGNHRVERDDGFLRIVVWRDIQIDPEAGALAFEQTVRQLAPVIPSIEAVAFDLREAPRVVGDRTQTALAGFLGALARLRRRIALISSDDAVQQLQLRRLVAEAAPLSAVVVMDEAAAAAFLGRDIHARQ